MPHNTYLEKKKYPNQIKSYKAYKLKSHEMSFEEWAGRTPARWEIGRMWLLIQISTSAFFPVLQDPLLFISLSIK